MQSKPQPRWTLLGLVAVALSGCATAPPVSTPPALPEPMVSALREARPVPARAGWWQTFGDTHLDQVMTRTLAQSGAVLARRAQLASARGRVDEARAARLPTVTLTGRGGYDAQVMAFGEVRSATAGTQLVLAYQVGLEDDADQSAATATAAESAETTRAFELTTTFEVATAYYGVRAAQARIAVLEAQVEVNRAHLRVVERRAEAGLAPQLDVQQQTQLLLATESALHQAKEALKTARHQLAVWSGTPSIAVTPAAWPADVVEAPSPLTARQLSQRPDVRAAWHRVQATGHRVRAARATGLPTFGVEVVPGYTWQHNTITGQPASTASGLTFAAAANVRIPLFDGQLAAARTQTARTAVRAAQATLMHRLHVARAEVAQARQLEAHRRAAVDLGTRQVAVAQAALSSARARYRQGTADQRTVLRALEAWQRAELDLVRDQHALVASRIGVHRAFGGPRPTQTDPRGDMP